MFYRNCISTFVSRTKVGASIFVTPVRHASKKRCVIYWTDNTNPYNNLAFEDWMYEKVTFHDTDCLFVWRNEPCVVIGRHQNPWKEANVQLAMSSNVRICRRNSGGGAVYHDLGNTNFTFFTERAGYDRKKNLQVIAKTLKKTWPGLNVEINQRDDIVLSGQYKISGSSAKLGRTNAYHHCTLLLDADKTNLLKYLNNGKLEMTCNATNSVSSNVLNLCDVDSTISFNEVRDKVSSTYSSVYPTAESYYVDTTDESLFPNISKMSEKLESWEWVYGKTPNFKVQKVFKVSDLNSCTIICDVKKGRVDYCYVSLDGYGEVTNMFDSLLKGVKFERQHFVHAVAMYKLNRNPMISDIIFKCLLEFFEETI